MPNRGGPLNNKRKVLSSVTQSILLYGAPLSEVERYKTYENMLEKVQRKSIIRITRSYRKVLTVALQEIPGTPPIDLLVTERESQKCWELQKLGKK